MITVIGEKAIVTGGSRGIGRSIVLALAAAGCHVLFTYQSNQAAAKQVEQLARERGGVALGIQADFSSPSEMRRVFEYIPQNFGGQPAIYIGSAFASSIFMPTAMMDEASYDSMFAAVKGHYFALQQAASQIADGGRIVLLSSGASKMPSPASGAYAGAKAAIERFAFSLAKELGSRQITVNVISPGVTATDGLVAPQPMIDALVAQTPLGRLGTPDEIASAVLLLCTPQAGWITGQNIQVNGGIL
jgi:3-oxoacyl-[acyl-carrier protein] reductase